MSSQAKQTVQQFMNRIISLADEYEGFVNNMDSTNFMNLANDIQMSVYRELYPIYGDDSPWIDAVIQINENDGFFNWGHQNSGWSVTTSLSRGNHTSKWHPTNTVKTYTEYFWLLPFAILSVQHQNSGGYWIPMERYNSAIAITEDKTYDWTNRKVRYDFRPPRMHFDPINKNVEEVKIIYVPKPAPLTATNEYIDFWVHEHMELAVIMGAALLKIKDGGNGYAELMNAKDRYINNLKEMKPRDYGQPVHIPDVQHSMQYDPYATEHMNWIMDR